MRTIYIILVCTIILIGNLYSQESSNDKKYGSIFLKDGKVIRDVQLWSVDTVLIEYVKYGNLADVKTIDVSFIKRSDGSQIVFDIDAFEKGENVMVKNSLNNQHVLSVNTLDLMISMFTVNYTYLSSSRKIGIKLPCSIGLRKLSTPSNGSYYNHNGNKGYYNSSKKFSTGIELNLFPAGIKKVSYYLSPSFEYGEYDYFIGDEYTATITSILYTPNTNTYSKYEKHSGSYYAILIQHGLLLKPTEHFCMTAYLGMGFSKYENKLYRPGNFLFPGLCARAGFTLGYVF